VHFAVKVTRQTSPEMLTKQPQTTIKTGTNGIEKFFGAKKAFNFERN